jgi:glycosyltransferase involved in cell wall biosynthesis
VIVGYHAPLPPAPTGVADYAAALLAELEKLCEVRTHAGEASVHLYQLGNNHLHGAIYDRALATSGVVLLHDANLHHFYLGRLTGEEYVREFAAQYGAWHEATARQLFVERALSAADPRYFQFPMLGKVLAGARAVIVHNRAAAVEVLRHSGGRDLPVEVIPHLMPPAPAPREGRVARLRERYAIAPSEFVLGVFGHLRPTKRIAAILRAFQAARARGVRQLRLVIAGEPVSREWDDAFDWRQPGLIRLGFLPGAEFWDWAHLVDAGVNLRYPSSSETSGIALRLMAAGKPVIVTAGEEWSGMPEGAVIPIGGGLGEQDELCFWMDRLAVERAWCRSVGTAARAHLERVHAPAAVARQVLAVLARAV